MNPSHYLAAYLAQSLFDLESVEEPLPHHPEENALVHSLQTFEIARNNSDNATLIAAALLHDIGKSRAIEGHAALGAELLQGVLPHHVVWLVEHHMDLLYEPKRTERVYKNTQRLQELKLLRKWDLQGRLANVRVCSVDVAVSSVCNGLWKQ